MKIFGVGLINKTHSARFAMASRALALAGLVACFTAVPARAGSVVYNQPASYPAGSICPCWTSSLDSGGNGYVTYDNFTLATTASIGAMSWQGAYIDYVTTANNPVPPDTNSWRVSIYADNSGAPDAQLFAKFLAAGSVSTTFAGTYTFPPGLFDGSTVSVYNFTFDFSSPFTALAATTYWIAPVSNQTNFNPVFAWALGTGGDGQSYQVGFVGGPGGYQPGDRAFSLTSATPEPNSLILFGTGALCFISGRRRC